MRLPRDISGIDLATLLQQLGYSTTRQTGSHMRLTTKEHGEHHITVPIHPSLRIGTLSSILTEIAGHFGISKELLVERLFSSK